MNIYYIESRNYNFIHPSFEIEVAMDFLFVNLNYHEQHIDQVFFVVVKGRTGEEDLNI